MNAQRKIDVATFLSRYDHVDELLKDQGIDIHRVQASREPDAGKLVYDYSEYLKERKSRAKREKSEGTIGHDMALLAFVRQQRTRVTSSLNAGALLLTCDAILCKFDWIDTRRRQGQVCTIMPDVLWQILRPFLFANPQLNRENFDCAFAATFAMPELRSIDVSAPREKARERMLYMLAKFEGISEATATRLLSNDLLLDKLRTDMNEDEFQRQVQLIALDDNAVLLEDKVALEQEIERQRDESEAQQTEMRIAHEEALLEERARAEQVINEERARAEQIINEERARAAMLLQQRGTEKDKLALEMAQVEKAKREVERVVREKDEETGKRLLSLETQLQVAERKRLEDESARKARFDLIRKVVIALGVSLILAVCLVLLVQFVPVPPVQPH